MTDSILYQYRFISEKSLNGHGTLFGGTAMEWMDEAAYILATRYTRKKMVTGSVNRIKFLTPIYPGTIVEIKCEIMKAKTTCLEIKVEIFVEDMYSEMRQKAVEACFLFLAVSIQQSARSPHPGPLLKRRG